MQPACAWEGTTGCTSHGFYLQNRVLSWRGPACLWVSRSVPSSSPYGVHSRRKQKTQSIPQERGPATLLWGTLKLCNFLLCLVAPLMVSLSLPLEFPPIFSL